MSADDTAPALRPTKFHAPASQAIGRSGRVVSSNPVPRVHDLGGPLIQEGRADSCGKVIAGRRFMPSFPSDDQLQDALDRYHRTPRDAFAVFLAVAEQNVQYDFLSETEAGPDGSFTITIRATPQGKP